MTEEEIRKTIRQEVLRLTSDSNFTNLIHAIVRTAFAERAAGRADAGRFTRN